MNVKASVTRDEKKPDLEIPTKTWLLFVAVKQANFDEMKRLLDLKGDVHHDHVRKEIKNRDVIYKRRILIVERAERSGLSIPTSTNTSKSLIALFLL